MTVTLIEDPTPALAALVGNVPGLEVFYGRTSDGRDWITVTWPAREIVMQRDVAGGLWQAYVPSQDDAIGTGATPADALRAALTHE